LCSCVDDTDVRPAPAPIVKPTNAVSNVEPLPVKQEVVEPVAENNEQKPIIEPESAPSSGNPLIDFFRSVDRGVKSTTENSGGPEPIEPEGANN